MLKNYFSLLRKVLRNQIKKRNVRITSEEDKWKYAAAYFVSRILGPFPLLILLWFVTAVKSGIGFWKALWVYPLIGFVGIGLPFLVSTWILFRKKSTDLEWTDTDDRVNVILITLFFWFLSTILVKYLTNQTIFHLTLLAGGIGIILFLITAVLRFRISLHISAASGVFWGINFLTHFKFLWLFILLIPVIWSRYVLKAHTLAELTAGLILTNGLIILAILLFGLPRVPQAIR